MAEKKEHKIVSASTGADITGKPRPAASAAAGVKSGNATGLRIGAVLFWIAALAFEVLAIALILEKLLILPKIQPLHKGIAALVLDMVCVIVGSQFWKKANHIDPASQKNALKFWLWNNMGVIVACFAFIPMIILMLTNKDLDKKTKTIAVIAAVIALLIGGAASVDYNPVSQEQLQAAEATFGDQLVYWSPFGHVYHTHTDCQALNVSETLTEGTIDQAVAANRTRLCKFCANRDSITTVVTDEQ